MFCLAHSAERKEAESTSISAKEKRAVSSSDLKTGHKPMMPQQDAQDRTLNARSPFVFSPPGHH